MEDDDDADNEDDAIHPNGWKTMDDDGFFDAVSDPSEEESSPDGAETASLTDEVNTMIKATRERFHKMRFGC